MSETDDERGDAGDPDDLATDEPDPAEPWAKASSGDVDEA